MHLSLRLSKSLATSHEAPQCSLACCWLAGVRYLVWRELGLLSNDGAVQVANHIAHGFHL